MPEDQIRRAFAALNRPVAPSPEFTDALFDRLLEESGRRPRVLPVRRGPRLSPGTRRILTIAAALLIASLVIAITLSPFRDFLSGPRPVDVGPFGPMPPSSVTLERHIPASTWAKVSGNSADEQGSPAPTGPFRDDVITMRISWDERGRWRVDFLSDSNPLANAQGPGDFWVFDGDRVTWYDAGNNLYSKSDIAPGLTPINLLTWDGTPAAKELWDSACGGRSEGLPGEEVSGVAAQHVRCGPWEAWLDPQTGVILKLLLDAGETDQPIRDPIGILSGETRTVTDLEYEPSFPARTFTFVKPEGSISQAEFEQQKPPTKLTIGQEVPTFAVPLMAGGTFDPASTRGRPTALYFWASWCPPCLDTPLDSFNAASEERAGRMNLVTIVSNDNEGDARKLVADHGYTFPVAVDADGTILRDTIGGEGIPMLVLLDADGRFVGAYSGFQEELSKAHLDAILDALAAGKPLPHVDGVYKEQI